MVLENYTLEELKLIREALSEVIRSHGLREHPIVAVYTKVNRHLLAREKE